jgi:hypothetical protein
VFAGHRSSVGCSQGIVCQRVTFVRELPLSESYLCQRVTFVKELRWGVTFVFASYHHGHSSAWCLLGVVCLSGSYLCQRVASGSYLCVCWVSLWHCVCWLTDYSVVCQLLSQGRSYAHGGRPCGVFVCLFTLAG